jgi:hypothetical protein
MPPEDKNKKPAPLAGEAVPSNPPEPAPKLPVYIREVLLAQGVARTTFEKKTDLTCDADKSTLLIGTKVNIVLDIFFNSEEVVAEDTRIVLIRPARKVQDFTTEATFLTDNGFEKK